VIRSGLPSQRCQELGVERIHKITATHFLAQFSLAPASPSVHEIHSAFSAKSGALLAKVPTPCALGHLRKSWSNMNIALHGNAQGCRQWLRKRSNSLRYYICIARAVWFPSLDGTVLSKQYQTVCLRVLALRLLPRNTSYQVRVWKVMNPLRNPEDSPVVAGPRDLHVLVASNLRSSEE